MKYIITWIDATLKENLSKKWVKDGKWKEDGTTYLVESDGDGWVEYEATHAFEAKDDEEAKEYAKKYNFDYRNVEVWSLRKENKTILTEEDLCCS